MGIRALVWGGSGFVGRSLSALLAGRGTGVTVLTRRPLSALEGTNKDPQIRFVSHGYERTNAARRVLDAAVEDADVIYNLAGSSGAVRSNEAPLEDLEANCAWQLELLEACRRTGSRPHVVFASSRLVYGRAQTLPVDEGHPIAPESIYATNKLSAENYHQVYARPEAITYTICRISVAYGRDPRCGGKAHGFLNTMIENALAGLPLKIFGSGEQLRDYIHVRDLAGALAACGESPAARNRILNVGSGKGVRIADAARTLASLTNVPVIQIPWPESHLQVETGDFVNDISQLVSVTGFSPLIDFQEGLTEEVRFAARDTTQIPSGPIAATELRLKQQ